MADHPARTVELLAELHLEVDGPGGFTHVHVSGGPEEIVVDVDDPVAALRAGPGLRTLSRLARTTPDLPAGLAPELRVRFRSDGRDLGSARTGRDGRVHVRPTGSGVRTVVRAATSGPRARVLVAGTVTAGLLVLALARAGRRGARAS